MYCTQCGSHNDDSVAFCTSCGKPLRESDVAVTQTDGAVASEASHAAPDGAPSGKRTKAIIGIVIAAVVVIALIVCGIVWFNLDQANKAMRAPHRVLVTINADGYSAQDTLIPIRATGTDLDGKSVDEVFFVDAAGEGVSLSKGDYVLSVAASPLTEDGILYKDVSATFAVVVSEDLDESADVDARTEVVFDMEKSTALDQTQEMIDKAYELAVQDPDQVDKADALVEKAQQAHDEAIAAKQREEELARARQNPASVNAVNGPVTLKGMVVRQVRTTDETGMGWASVDYLLRFDSPVSITYKASSGETRTSSFSQIQIESTELYIASDPNANLNIKSKTISKLQPFVGQYVAVTGDIYDGGTMYTYGNARFGNYSIASI